MNIRKQQKIKRTVKNRDIKKMILALNLSIAQINLSMRDGSYSIDTLIDSFTAFKDISDIQNNPVLTEKVTNSIIAFQFYDKLSQRLHHVEKGLSILNELLINKKISDEKEWLYFKDKMQKFTSMAEEYNLYDMIFNQGKSIEYAINYLIEQDKKDNSTSDEEDVFFF